MEENSRNSNNGLSQSVKYSCKTQEQSTTKPPSMADVSLDTKNTHRVNVIFILDSLASCRSVFRKETTIGTIKKSLSDISEVDEKGIRLMWGDKELDDSKLLGELEENSSVPVEIKLDFTNSKLGIEKFKENIPLLDVITVHPQYGEFENITVVIEDQAYQKQWLGGYRSKLNKKEYHNAFAQTTPEYTRAGNEVELVHRDTQTVKLNTSETSTVTSRGTQMWRQDYYISPNNDKIISAKPLGLYGSSEPQLQRLNSMARVIQKFWHSYRVRKRVLNFVKHLKQKQKEKIELIEKISLEHALEERKMLVRSVYPTKNDDFYLLHLGLGLWLNKNLSINLIQRTDLTRKAKLYLMQKTEVNCLFAIQKHKTSLKKEVLKKEEMRFLEKTARPKIFKNKNRKLVTVDDIETQRAREFKEIYSELIKREVKTTERVNFLNNLKKFFSVSYSTYEYANEVVSLVDREIHLITMGMRNKDLKGVRMRIEQLFMYFVQQKEFNPKAAKYEKPNLPHTVQQKYQCTRCSRLMPASLFPVHFRMKDYSVCTSCTWMYDIGHIHIDIAPYKKLLKQVRRDEMDKCGQSAISFLLQPPGMVYLTTIIWHNHSAISECDVMRRLRHVRWLPNCEWSPWNTILLTAEEAQFHCSIPDVHQFYDPSFITKVHSKHMMARNHFKDLERVGLGLCSSGEWTSAEEADFYFQKHYAEGFVAKDDFDVF